MRLLVEAGCFQRTHVPLDGNRGHLLFHETNRQQTARLEEIRRKVSFPRTLHNLLKLSNGFVQQPHLPESHTQIVMGLGIILGGLRRRAGLLHLRQQTAELRHALSWPVGGGAAATGEAAGAAGGASADAPTPPMMKPNPRPGRPTCPCRHSRRRPVPQPRAHARAVGLKFRHLRRPSGTSREVEPQDASQA